MEREPLRCEVCGAPSPVDDAGTPECPAHGRRWVHVRNAPCAAVVIYDAERRVLLSRRAREPFAGMWETPGGFVEMGEHPEDAARREVREELGVEVELTGLVGTYVVRSERGGWLLVMVYAGVLAPSAVLLPDPSEVTDVAWFEPREVPEVMAGDHRRRIADWADHGAVALPARG